MKRKTNGLVSQQSQLQKPNPMMSQTMQLSFRRPTQPMQSNLTLGSRQLSSSLSSQSSAVTKQKNLSSISQNDRSFSLMKRFRQQQTNASQARSQMAQISRKYSTRSPPFRNPSQFRSIGTELHKINTMSLIKKINMKLNWMQVSVQADGSVTSAAIEKLKEQKTAKKLQESSKSKKGRKKQTINLDRGIKERIKDYLTSFPEDSLNHLLAQFSPVPNSQCLEDKFEYFYRPYNYICNSQKYISFDTQGVGKTRDSFQLYQEHLKEYNYMEEYMESVGLDVKRRSQSQPQKEVQLNSLLFEMELQNLEIKETRGVSQEPNKKKKQAIASWHRIQTFLLKDDPRTTYFVLNQLRYLTGQNQIKKKRKRMMRAKANKILPGLSRENTQQLIIMAEKFIKRKETQQELGEDSFSKRESYCSPLARSQQPVKIDIPDSMLKVDINEINNQITKMKKDQSITHSVAESIKKQLKQRIATIPQNVSMTTRQLQAPDTRTFSSDTSSDESSLITSKSSVSAKKPKAMKRGITRAFSETLKKKKTGLVKQKTNVFGRQNTKKINTAVGKTQSPKMGFHRQFSTIEKRYSAKSKKEYEKRLMEANKSSSDERESDQSSCKSEKIKLPKPTFAVDQQKQSNGIIEEVTDDFESVSLSEISRERDEQVRKALHIDKSHISAAKFSSTQKSEATPALSQRAKKSHLPLVKGKQSTNKFSRNKSRKQSMIIRRKKRFQEDEDSVSSEQTIKSDMSAPTKKSIIEKNCLKREKSKVQVTRKMAEDLKNYTTGGLMSRLKKAIIHKTDQSSMVYYQKHNVHSMTGDGKQSISNPNPKRLENSSSLRDNNPKRSSTKLEKERSNSITGHLLNQKQASMTPHNSTVENRRNSFRRASDVGKQTFNLGAIQALKNQIKVDKQHSISSISSKKEPKRFSNVSQRTVSSYTKNHSIDPSGWNLSQKSFNLSQESPQNVSRASSFQSKKASKFQSKKINQQPSHFGANNTRGTKIVEITELQFSSSSSSIAFTKLQKKPKDRRQSVQVNADILKVNLGHLQLQEWDTVSYATENRKDERKRAYSSTYLHGMANLSVPQTLNRQNSKGDIEPNSLSARETTTMLKPFLLEPVQLFATDKDQKNFDNFSSACKSYDLNNDGDNDGSNNKTVQSNEQQSKVDMAEKKFQIAPLPKVKNATTKQQNKKDQKDKAEPNAVVAPVPLCLNKELLKIHSKHPKLKDNTQAFLKKFKKDEIKSYKRMIQDQAQQNTSKKISNNQAAGQATAAPMKIGIQPLEQKQKQRDQDDDPELEQPSAVQNIRKPSTLDINQILQNQLLQEKHRHKPVKVQESLIVNRGESLTETPEMMMILDNMTKKQSTQVDRTYYTNQTPTQSIIADIMSQKNDDISMFTLNKFGQHDSFITKEDNNVSTDAQPKLILKATSPSLKSRRVSSLLRRRILSQNQTLATNYFKQQSSQHYRHVRPASTVNMTTDDQSKENKDIINSGSENDQKQTPRKSSVKNKENLLEFQKVLLKSRKPKISDFQQDAALSLKGNSRNNSSQFDQYKTARLVSLRSLTTWNDDGVTSNGRTTRMETPLQQNSNQPNTNNNNTDLEITTKAADTRRLNIASGNLDIPIVSHNNAPSSRFQPGVGMANTTLASSRLAGRRERNKSAGSRNMMLKQALQGKRNSTPQNYSNHQIGYQRTIENGQRTTNFFSSRNYSQPSATTYTQYNNYSARSRTPSGSMRQKNNQPIAAVQPARIADLPITIITEQPTY